MKYKFPINIYLVFEHTTPVIYTSEVLTPNHYVCVINSKWNHAINVFFKKELFYSFGTLIEMSAIDTLKYSNILKTQNLNFKENRLLIHNSYYFYLTKLRLTLFYQYSLNHSKTVYSLDSLYKNSNWLERETSEMFSILFKNKYDSRTLLLDYAKKEHPLLKTFASEGNFELYYDFIDQNLYYSDVKSVEL